jgi:hypothetical protein
MKPAVYALSDPFAHLTALEEAEVIPGKHSDTRTKPLALAKGHGRYIAAAPKRTFFSVGEWPLHMAVIDL